MKFFVCFAVLLGALCTTYSFARPFSDKDAEIETVLDQLSQAKLAQARYDIVESQDERRALAQNYLHFLLREAQEQAFDKARIESILSKIRKSLIGLMERE